MNPTIEQIKQAARKFSSNAALANPDEKALHTYTDAAGNPLPVGLVDGNGGQILNQLVGIGITIALAVIAREPA